MESKDFLTVENKRRNFSYNFWLNPVTMNIVGSENDIVEVKGEAQFDIESENISVERVSGYKEAKKQELISRNDLIFVGDISDDKKTLNLGITFEMQINFGNNTISLSNNVEEFIKKHNIEKQFIEYMFEDSGYNYPINDSYKFFETQNNIQELKSQYDYDLFVDGDNVYEVGLKSFTPVNYQSIKTLLPAFKKSLVTEFLSNKSLEEISEFIKYEIFNIDILKNEVIENREMTREMYGIINYAFTHKEHSDVLIKNIQLINNSNFDVYQSSPGLSLKQILDTATQQSINVKFIDFSKNQKESWKFIESNADRLGVDKELNTALQAFEKLKQLEVSINNIDRANKEKELIKIAMSSISNKFSINESQLHKEAQSIYVAFTSLKEDLLKEEIMKTARMVREKFENTLSKFKPKKHKQGWVPSNLSHLEGANMKELNYAWSTQNKYNHAFNNPKQNDLDDILKAKDISDKIQLKKGGA